MKMHGIVWIVMGIVATENSWNIMKSMVQSYSAGHCGPGAAPAHPRLHAEEEEERKYKSHVEIRMR